MVINIQNPVNNNYTHRIELEQPHLFAFSTMGFGLKGLFDGYFLDHLIINKDKNLYELYVFIDDFVNALQKQANIAISTYTKYQQPLPSLKESFNIGVDAIVLSLPILASKNEISNPKEILEILRTDIKDSITKEQDVLQPDFDLAEYLVNKFHSHLSDEYINRFLSDLSTNIAFVVTGTDLIETSVLGDNQPIREFMKSDYYMDDGWIILFFFSVERMNRDTYLAFPLMLMHEFLSHIYTVDFNANAKKISSQAFLEGWMVWAIEEYLESFGEIRFLQNRVDSFKKIRCNTYDSLNSDYSPSICMGRDTARWFCKKVKWDAFLKISQELLLAASDPKDMAEQISLFSPPPSKRLHEEFIIRLNMIMRQFDGKKRDTIDEKYKEIFSRPPSSLIECWNGIFNKCFDLTE